MKKLIILLIVASAFLIPMRAAAAEARIADMVAWRSPVLSVTFAVEDAFTKEIEEAIKSGVPTSFNFFIELDRVRSGWFNASVAKVRLTHTVKYDSLKEEYEISIDEMGEKTIRTKDINQMKALMSVVTSVDINTAAPLQPGQDYELRVKAELHSVELPFRLDYVLFFVKLWNFETSWYTYRFTD